MRQSLKITTGLFLLLLVADSKSDLTLPVFSLVGYNALLDLPSASKSLQLFLTIIEPDNDEDLVKSLDSPGIVRFENSTNFLRKEYYSGFSEIAGHARLRLNYFVLDIPPPVVSEYC
jgi:hypothetical protein